jgi:hypothetical protein
MHRRNSARLTGIGATRLAIAGELAATNFKLRTGPHHRNMAEISRTKGFPRAGSSWAMKHTTRHFLPMTRFGFSEPDVMRGAWPSTRNAAIRVSYTVAGRLNRALPSTRNRGTGAPRFDRARQKPKQLGGLTDPCKSCMRLIWNLVACVN